MCVWAYIVLVCVVWVVGLYYEESSVLVVFSASLGILMNLITNMYEEGQERRNRLQQLAKYMNWRLLPREMKSSIRRYLNFVWETSEVNLIFAWMFKHSWFH